MQKLLSSADFDVRTRMHMSFSPKPISPPC